MAAIATSMPQASWMAPKLVWTPRNSPGLIRLLTVDAHPLVREGLATIINKEPDMQVVAESASGAEALAVFRRTRPDVVTLDLELPDMPGEAVARAILTEAPSARLVVITNLQGDAHILRALGAGVKGVALKGMPNEELLEVIRQVSSGRKFIPRQVASALADHLGEETLTPREVQVLRLVARGNRNKEVAAHLAIADETVRMHMKNILGKLAAHDRTHAVTIALTRGFISL